MIREIYDRKILAITREEFNEKDWIIEFSLRKPEYGIEVLKNKAKELGIKISLKGI